MPNVEKLPTIDPTVKYVGVSKLRGLNADKLRETTETFVLQDNDQPLAVLLTYEKFLAMQAELQAVTRTVEMLSDNAELEALRLGVADLQANRLHTLADIDAELGKGRG